MALSICIPYRLVLFLLFYYFLNEENLLQLDLICMDWNYWRNLAPVAYLEAFRKIYHCSDFLLSNNVAKNATMYSSAVGKCEKEQQKRKKKNMKNNILAFICKSLSLLCFLLPFIVGFLF